MSARKSSDHSGKKPTIGVILGDVNAYTDLIWSGIATRAEMHGFNTLAFVGRSISNNPVEKSTSNIIYQLINENIVDGLIILTAGIGSMVSHQELIDFCHQFSPLPVVSIGTQIEGLSNILADNSKGLRDLICHLIVEHNCHRIASIQGPLHNTEALIRHQTLKQELADHDLPFDSNLIISDVYDYQGGEAATEELLQRAINFDAVVCFNDAVAWGVQNCLRKNGKHVPNDVAVVGFDDIAGNQYSIPPLSTVRQPRYEIGEQALEAIRDLLYGSKTIQDKMLPTEMVVRQSCGCLSPEVQRLNSIPIIPPANVASNDLTASHQKVQLDFVQTLEKLPKTTPTTKESAIQLFEAFSNSLEVNNSEIFLNLFDSILHQAGKRNEDLAIWQDVLSILRFEILHHLPSLSATAFQVENLIQQARILLSDIAQQVQFFYRHRFELKTQSLFEINEEVITTFDLPRLMDALVEALQQLGISYCFLCLNGDPGSTSDLKVLPLWSRMIMAYQDGEQLKLEPAGIRFPTEEFLPEGILSNNLRYDLAILPLRFQNHYLGYAVFEMGYREGFIYDALQIQISSAIRGAYLIQQLNQAQTNLESQVKDRTAKLEKEIADRVRIEEFLRENEQRYRALFDQNNDAVFIFDLDTKHIMVNQKAADMLGYTVEELIRKGNSELVAPNGFDDGQDKLEMALAGQPVPIYERNLIHKDGYLIPVEINLSLVSDTDGNPLHFQSIVRDITQHKQAEQALKAEIDERKRTEKILRENEQRYRALFEQTTDAVFIVSLEGEHLAVNQRAADLLGYRAEEMIGMPASQIIIPDELDQAMDKLAMVRQGKSLPIYERNLLHKNGSIIPVEISITLVSDDDGNPIHIQSVIRDITKRKRTERVLQTLNLATLAMRNVLSPDEIFETIGSELKALGFECTIFQTNPDLSEIYPKYYSFDGAAISAVEKLIRVDLGKFVIPVENVEIFQKTIWDQEPVIIREPREPIGQLLPKPTKGLAGQIIRLLNLSRFINVPLIVADQTMGMLSVHAKDLLEEDIPMVMAFAHQVAAAWQKARLMQDLESSLAEQLRVEESLRENEEKYRTLFELSPEAVLLIDLNGIILDANQTAFRLGGLRKEEIIGKSIWEIGFFDEGQSRYYLELFNQLIDGDLVEPLEIQIKVRDDVESWIEVYPALLKKGDEILALQIIIRDITEQKFAELAVQQRVTELEAIYQTSIKIANASLRVDEIARIAVQQVGRITNVDACSFSVLVEQDRKLTVIADLQVEGEKQIFIDQEETIFLDDYPATEHVLLTLLPQIVQASDPEADPAERAYMQKSGTATLLMVPLAVKNRAIGMMELETREEYFYTENQLNLVMTLANQIAVAMDNARLFEAAQQELLERLQAETALQESEERFRSIFENAVMGLYRSKPNGQIIMANPALVRMLGYTSFEELLEYDFEIDGLSWDHPHSKFRKLIEQEGQIIGLESAWKRRDGSTLFVQENARAIYDNAGEIIYFEGTVEDITQRKQVETLQRLSEERFNKAFNISPLAMGIQGVDREKRGVWLLVNDAFTRTTGYNRDEVIGHSTQELQLYANEDQQEQAISTFFDQGYISEFEFVFRKKSGELRDGLLWSQSIQIGGERNVLVLVQDITERKQIEAERQNLMEFQQIVAGLSTQFINLETSEIELEIEQALGIISEYAGADACSVWIFDSAQSSISKTFNWPSNQEDEIHRDFPIERFPWIFGKLINAEDVFISGKQEIPLDAKEMHLWLQNYNLEAILAVPLISEGRVLGSISFYMREIEKAWAEGLEPLLKIIGDIIINALERKRAEESIRQLNEELEMRVVQRTQQLEAANKELEAFAYSVSHDLRAPLRALDGFSLALIEDYGERLDETAENYLHRVRAASQRMGQLIDDLLKLSRITRSDMVYKPVNLSEIALEIVLELQGTEPERMLEFEIQPDLVVLGDEHLMRIALVNLLNNAWKFTREKSQAQITFGCTTEKKSPVFFVQDNGAGFDMAYADKLFGTFQRLHSTQDFEGSGIGLATAKRIILRHGGNIWAESQVGQGATFYFTIGKKP